MPNRSELIALSYGITYIWGTVGIILICKYFSRWWGVDAKAAAKKYEEEFGVRDLEGGGLTGFRPFGLRAYRLENPAQVGQTIAGFRKKNPEYQRRSRWRAAGSRARSGAAEGRRHCAGRVDSYQRSGAAARQYRREIKEAPFRYLCCPDTWRNI